MRGVAHNAFVAIAILVIIFLVTQVGTGSRNSLQEQGLAITGAFSQTSIAMNKGVFHFAVVADLDKKSRVEGKKPTFQSILKEGVLTKTGSSWSVSWTDEYTLTSQHNEAGRGMELSELVFRNNRLLTFDDRTGLIYEISDKRKVIPRWVMMEGDGNTNKGQKTEWATMKDGVLYAGSFGKEYVKGREITSRNNLWVSKVTPQGEVEHEDWTDNYNKIRDQTNSRHPAYQIIETLVWSSIKRRWFCLPRRVSQDPYDEDLDEKRGSNIVIHCDEFFHSCEKFEIGTIIPERGFSSAKFIPGTNDDLMVALKSEENEKLGTQTTYISVLNLKEKRLELEETKVGDCKYEGVVFI